MHFKILNIMYRYFFRFVVMTLTILTANLIASALSDYMVSYKNQYRPVIFTLVGMAITVIVFYPLFIKLEDWVKAVSFKLIRSGKSFAGRYLGLLISFLFGLTVLFYFYARIWYGIDYVNIILHGTIG